MEDRSIVALYQRRDESAIEHTQLKYGTYLYKIAFQILADSEDSQESVNDTYLAAWNSIPPHEPSVLSTFLGKLTRRISIDIFRKRNSLKRRGSEYAISLSELEDCISDGIGPEETLELAYLGKAISDYLRTVSADARTCFIARYFYMDPLKDVARYCQMSESKVKSLLYRTRCGLKDHLVKEGFL